MSTLNKSFTHKALYTSIVIALSGIASGAIAQEGLGCNEEGAEAEQRACLEEIVVTGFRRQIRSAIDAKSEAVGVADFLASDDFGKQPDLNLADSLRRLPGVSTIFDEDEGRFVSVRGLPSRYTTITLNGAIIPNAWGAMKRDQNIEAIPSFAVKRAGVYKSLTADLDGNSIGGYVDNTLVSAFDKDGFNLVSDVRMGYHSYMDTPGGESNPSPKVQVRVSDLFGADDQFGYIITGSYFDKHRDQSKSNRTAKYSSDGTPYISRAEAVDYSNSIERWSVLGRLEYRGDNFYTAVSASHFDYQYDEVRYIARIDGRGGVVSPTAEGGSFAEGRAELILDRFPIGTETEFLMWDLNYDFDNGGVLTSNISIAESRYELFDDASSINFRTPDLEALGYSYDLTGQDLDGAKLTPITLNDATALQNTASYGFTGDFWPRADEEGQDISQVKVDYAFRMGEEGFGYKVGASIRHFESWVDNNRAHFYDPVDDDTFPTADAFVANYVDNPELGLSVPAIDPGLFLEYFYEHPDQFKDNEAKGAADVLKADLDYEEDIVAAYALASYSGANYKITAGLRYEGTDFEGAGRNNSDGNAVVTRTGSYSDVLPSIVGYYEIADGLKLRAGYNKSIGRPNPADIARRETVSEGDGGDIFVNRGNPDLKPRRADNFDLALDYSIGGGAFLSIGYFYKELEDEIFTFKDVTDFVNDAGDTVQLTTSQPTNLSDASVQGVELTLIDDKFDWLPEPWNGFGFASNFTWLEADLDLPQSDEDASITRNITQLNGSQKFKVNASLLYEYGPFEAKLTYADHSERRNSASTSGENSDQFIEPYTQWDIFARYTISDNLQVFIEGRNITNEVRVTTYGSGIGRETNEFGKSYWLGISYKM